MIVYYLYINKPGFVLGSDKQWYYHARRMVRGTPMLEDVLDPRVTIMSVWIVPETIPED